MARTDVHHIHSRMKHQFMHVSETHCKFDFQITLENSFVLVFVLAPQPRNSDAGWRASSRTIIIDPYLLLAGHVCSNSSKCLVPKSVALSVSSVLYVNFTHEICKGSHFGFTNGLQPNKLEPITLDIAALNKLVGYPKSRI